MKSLSVVVSVYNGGQFLDACLSSVKDLGAEIVVVDHYSTDQTKDIAKKYTKKIYQQKNDSSRIDIQKNFGFEKATGEWILSLDADEKITPELADEIKNVLSNNSVFLAYNLPRKNIIFGKWIEHTGWYPDYQVRLFQKGKGKFTEKHVHEAITTEGEVGQLNSPLLHEAYQSVGQFLQRGLLIYAPNEAEAKKAQGYSFSFLDAIRFPLQEFLSRFFAREGYKDGFYGLALSLLMAMYHEAVFLYLWEMENFPDKENSLGILWQQTNIAQKELEYWVKEVEIKDAKNPAAKVLLKAKRKLGL